MNESPLRERLHSFAIGIGLAVVLMGICWGATMLIWAVSDPMMTFAPNQADQRLRGRSAILADASVSLPDDWEGRK